MNTINKTLLNNLFLDTKYTTPQQEIYSIVKSRIFPNADEYIHFLQLFDMNEKRELAKKIIKRLCMFSNYQPPYELIINISKQEKNNKNQSINKNYIPQDHFVHIVNLYIFGVYLFFEHPSSARELNFLFSDKRKGDNYLRKINAVNDFISSWKSFCLYHDIGYPFEIYYGNDETLSEDQLKELIDFDDIYLHLKNQLTVKALAKLVVINSLIEETVKNRTFRDVSSILCYKFNPVMCDGEQLYGNNMSFVNDYYELEDIYSYEQFKMFLGFIDQKDVMKVLFYRVHGHPVAFSYNNENKKYVYKNAEVTVPITDEELDFIFSHDDIPYDSKFGYNYELKYYIKDLATSFECKLHNNITKEKLNYVLELVKEEQKIMLDFKHINCEDDLNNLIFEVYGAITNILKMYLSEFSPEEREELAICNFRNIYLKNLRIVYKKYVDKKIIKEIENCLTNGLNNQNSDRKEKLVNDLLNDTPNKDNFEKYIKQYILDCIKEVFLIDDCTKTTKCIVKQMTDTIQTEIARRDSLIQSYAIISNIIETNCKEVKIDKCIYNDKFETQLLLDAAMKNKRFEAEFQDITNNMSKRKYVSIDNLIRNYKRHTRYDHGMCSGIIYLYINSVSSFFAEKLNNNEADVFTKMLIPLFWTINPKQLSYKLLSNYKHIHEETFHAIFCHNIFSKKADTIFKLTGDEKWITKIDKEAFLYFCMLCDSLQHWDRENYYDPRIIDYNPLFAMDSYNISIKNDKIIIKTVAYTSNYDDIVKEFNFDDFLEGCSKYLSLEIKPK